MTKWLITETLHVIPIDDYREHTEHNCWCIPTPDAEEPKVMIHHSMDRREFYENGTLKEH